LLGGIKTYQIVIKLYQISVSPLLQSKWWDCMLSKFQHPCMLLARLMPRSP